MRLEVMSSRGHDNVHEWTLSSPPERLREVQERFRELTSQGYTAFGAVSGERLKEFDPKRDESVVMIPRFGGG